MDSVLFGRTLDPPLDRHGERQARALAVHFGRCTSGHDGVAIEASPRRRTRQTAIAIARTWACPVVTEPDMDEIDFGCWGGQPFSVLWNDPRWRRWNEQRAQASTPAGESIEAVQSRAMRHLRALAHVPARSVLIVTHAEVIRAIVLRCLDAPIDRYRDLDIAPASMTTLRLQDGVARVLSVNECVPA